MVVLYVLWHILAPITDLLDSEALFRNSAFNENIISMGNMQHLAMIYFTKWFPGDHCVNKK